MNGTQVEDMIEVLDETTVVGDKVRFFDRNTLIAPIMSQSESILSEENSIFKIDYHYLTLTSSTCHSTGISGITNGVTFIHILSSNPLT